MKLLKPLLANTNYDIFYIYIHKGSTLYFVKPKRGESTIGSLSKSILETSHVKWIVKYHIKEDRYVSPNINTMVKSISIPPEYLIHLENYKPKSSYSTRI